MDEPHLVAVPSMRHDDSSPASPERAPVDNDRNDAHNKLVVIFALMFVAALAAISIPGAALSAVFIAIVNALSKR